jgi:hypothetical protein
MVKDIMEAKTGDTVLHGPTGEEWMVAYADAANNRIAWCGWPPGRAKLSDCTIVYVASAEESEKLIREMAEGRGDDHRFAWARRELAARGGEW